MSDEFDVPPHVQARQQIQEAIADLYRGPEEYHHLPWPALDKAIGGMPGGEICFIVAFSSNGKTLFLTSLLNELYDNTKKKIYYMGLESRPKTLRTHWAAKRLGYDAGDFFSGKFLEWPNHQAIRADLNDEVNSQEIDPQKMQRVRFCPAPYIDAKNIVKAADQAEKFGADIFIIDHVDHIDGKAGANHYAQSREVNQALLNIAQDYGFLMLPASQLNNEAVKGNKIALHLPPQPQHVKMGGHKREIATWMLGLYRPLRVAGVSVADLKAVNAGMMQPMLVCEPKTMAVVDMKHRFYGQREGERVYLKVERGKVLDADQALYTQRTVTSEGMRIAP
jgi:KaiC/GvpD/RAD55 family RecA-like ATPase